jgi:hypothetical protein
MSKLSNYHTTMKTLLNAALVLSCVMFSATKMNAQTPPTSADVIDGILSVAENRTELTRLTTAIPPLLADQRLADQPARQTLSDSQPVFAEMLNQKIGTNSGKLVELAKWMRAQAEAKHSIQDAGGTPTPQQQFILDNPLAGEEVYLTSLLDSILGAYLERDRDAAGATKLEALLQLYLNFRTVIERSWWLADDFLLYAPQWIQSRYPQLTADQKRQFLKDVNDTRAAKARGPAADEEPAPQPTAAEQAAYTAAYQFIVNNTPQP